MKSSVMLDSNVGRDLARLPAGLSAQQPFTAGDHGANLYAIAVDVEQSQLVRMVAAT
jgi:hypothetical protein